MLTIDTIPLNGIAIFDCRFAILGPLFILQIEIRKSQILFIFSMQPMAAAATAELVELKPVRRVLFVLCRHVVSLFALGAL